MKVVVIGGVAAGTKTAAKLKREHPQDAVTIYTKGSDISYAGCGLPYYVGGIIEDRESLVVNTPEKFTALTGVQVYTNTEITQVEPEKHLVRSASGQEIPYDKLVIAAGAEPFVPPVPGTDLTGVFTVRTPQDAVRIRSYIKDRSCRQAVVVGGGFIGLEMAENLKAQGLTVTVMDMAPQLLPNLLDPEVADYVRRRLQKTGTRVMTGVSLQGLEGSDTVKAVMTSSGRLLTNLVILAVGIRPATGFLKDSGIQMNRGTIVTNEYHETNLPDIYAAGDCAQVRNRITGQGQWSAMGSTANIAGRNLALHLAGGGDAYPGCLGTGVVKVMEDLNAARTGLTEIQAKEAGYDAVSVTSVLNDKAHYYQGASSFIVKLIADRESHKLLGMQVLGSGSVDKMADVAVTAISLGARAEDLQAMDFSYAPPFSTAIHPMAAACSILVNKLEGKLQSFTPAEYAEGKAKGYRLVDAHLKPSIPGAPYFDLMNPRQSALQFQKDDKLLLVCAKGKRAYLSQVKLRSLGYENVMVLEGGSEYSVIQRPKLATLPASEIKRVKGLGCLWDKRFPDVFNVRVITRNGKITTDEHKCIAEAADRFGSGEITMTTRLTMEIQGVPYENIEPLIEYLADHGLETGGTGSLVRPIVSCKGTTCQYGLIDTFGLSEKLHKRFYQGYHQVTLPHKFKIAVGGCPNNCVKPNLNDLGIIGQRVPLFDNEKCRGCKICQVEKACPIHVASLKDGKLHVDPSECNHCGRCYSKCPFGVTAEYQDGYKVYIGGRWGKKIAHGRPLDKIFTSEEEVLDLVERAILLFRDEGKTGERFADTVTRLGFDYVQEKLLTAKIDKEEILHKTVTGGATC